MWALVGRPPPAAWGWSATAAVGPLPARMRLEVQRPELVQAQDHIGVAGLAVLGGPAPLLEPTHDHHAATLGQRLGGMLGLVAPDDDGEERRLLVPATRHGHPEHGPGDAALGVADLGLVGEVAGEADAGLGHGVPLPGAWPGGLPCPWTRGTVDTVACQLGHQGQATEPTKSAMHQARRPWVGSGAGLVGGALAAGGRACQHRPARSLHPGRGGRSRLPPREPLAARPRLSRLGSRPPLVVASALAGLAAGTTPQRDCGAARRCGRR
jgi:hypothetical protein